MFCTFIQISTANIIFRNGWRYSKSDY